MSLNQQLNTTSLAEWQRLSAWERDALETAVRDPALRRQADEALQAGDYAPEFTLPSVAGRTVQLADLLLDGPLVISFYRGGWCPYCRLSLRALDAALPAIRRAGAQVVALSPEGPAAARATAADNGLSLDLLSDADARTAFLYGLLYTMPADLIAFYRRRHLDLAACYGRPTWSVPLPATYVVGPDGMVAYGFVDPDFRRRADPSDVLRIIRRL
jgi:peroxiredoxin